MMSVKESDARAVADLDGRQVLARVEIAASPERVFQALTSQEIVDWWVRDGVFNTTEWQGDVRVGGSWRSAGLVNGQPYALEGEYLVVDPPRKLVHTWRRVGVPGGPTTVTYMLERLDAGTRLTLRHSGFEVPEACASVGSGWETSFTRLAEILAAEAGAECP